MIKVKFLVIASVLLNFGFWSGCKTDNIADVNVSMPKHRWSYINKIVTVVDIKDHTKVYDLFFKLRHTAAYRYSNIYILFQVKGPGKTSTTRRYEYKLGTADGKWFGAGSGDLYMYTLPLLTNYKFPESGKYTFVIEQSMLDNPLHHISDAGLLVQLHEGVN
ncbi:gliding motility lipoprotein GldH [Pedobacter sp.]|uniref:gliding motility lipoprotein GldH n=1 Tax=Pedobacter sp. TaxID=1411316 RepID=UPI003D7FABCB